MGETRRNKEDHNVTENRRNGARVDREMMMMMIGEEAEEESERAIIVKVKHRPELLNQEEVDQHFAANHVPFRSWCKHCVMGRSDGNAHRKSKNHDQQEVTTVSCDYGYMTSEVKQGEKEEDESGNPILFMVDRKSGKINAHVMPQKGLHPYAVKRVVQDIKLLGYSRINLKSDQEPAIRALLGAVKNEQRCEIVPEVLPVEKVKQTEK